ncbi:(2Fe-2S)-binding protein [Eudoraea chungangensis]|uniref:(2Fe-2S)-binding protein n=1 Tax=Eudoraea chungangensis TaxID=1481905 RepID=UPI0023EDF834|nr:(2Fe-2S)-binding protein [Eudoraea chungangensis]
MPSYKLTINSESISVEASPDIPLLWVIRDMLGLTGTKYGCGKGVCGACTVHFNGSPIKSCTMAIENADGGAITTIEGLVKEKEIMIKEAWIQLDVPQCGYCQAGQIMNAAALLVNNPNPSNVEIDNTMSSNLCRCGTYSRIKQAISLAAKNIKQ